VMTRLVRMIATIGLLAFIAATPTQLSAKAVGACTHQLSSYPCDCDYSNQDLEAVYCDFFPDPVDEESFCDLIDAICEGGMTYCFCSTYQCSGTCWEP